MKTTELFVEQVIIGFLVLLIATLPFANRLIVEGPKIADNMKPYGNTGAVAVASAIIIAAYLVGILCDRCLDTLLQDVEQHNRLTLAMTRRDHLLSNPGTESVDLHPEQVFRIAILGSAGALEYAAYLRSRIRLTR